MRHSFEIDRRTWQRGGGKYPIGICKPSATYLLNGTDGKMCCLGFYALSKGVDKETITNVSRPSKLPISIQRMAFPMGVETYCLGELMLANDSSYKWDEPHREDCIKRNFANMGVDVTFKN